MKWESQGGLIDDIYGHGTDTTGCAAANGNNGIGVTGVGWNLSHRMLRVTNSSGGGSSLATLNHAARTAAESGDKVVNTSYSGVDNSTNKETATYIKSLGGLSVWAAGNDGRRLTLNDRDADDIIVVGATDENDTKTSWSAYGPFVDVVAPGNNVYTTNRSSDVGYGANSGTSFAAPLTAGLLALIWSYNPSLTPNEVEAILKANCDDLGSAGKDDTYGYGRINVYKALVGTPPPGETLHPNTASTTKGNYISGNAASLGADDDNYWRQGTAYDPTDPAAVINSTMEAAANASQGSYTSGSIKVVEKINVTGPKYRIRGLRDDGSWGVLLDNQAAGMTETTLTTGLSPVNDYVRQANSNEVRLELRAASSNRFAFFQHYVDLVEWFLTP
jgi:subtilisin family serine protease